jgi:hypothetical protein
LRQVGRVAFDPGTVQVQAQCNVVHPSSLIGNGVIREEIGKRNPDQREGGRSFAPGAQGSEAASASEMVWGRSGGSAGSGFLMKATRSPDQRAGFLNLPDGCFQVTFFETGAKATRCNRPPPGCNRSAYSPERRRTSCRASSS